MSVLRKRTKTPAASEMEIFVAISKEWKLSKIDVTVVLDPV